MQTKTAYIISLKFAPGLKKEFMVLGENIREKGSNVKYLLSKGYGNLEGNCDGVEYITEKGGVKGLFFETVKLINSKRFTEIFSSNPPSFACFYNPHPLNPIIARHIKKKFPKALLSLYLHDPYKPDKTPYGFIKGAYFRLVEFIQGLTIKYMDYVISPSEYSSELFKKKYYWFKGENYIAPLLVPDMKIEKNLERKFFSIVGGAHPATGHYTFVELVNYVAEKGLDYRFALITSSDISKYLKMLTPKAKGILNVINKRLILDSEINEVVRQSYAVFRLDREVTQSGVVPVCYMNETPVIGRDIPGLVQHVKHGYTGYVVPANCSPEDIVDTMEFVKKNFCELFANARKSYEETWAEWNFEKYYCWLLELLKSQL
jgi:glycosyltransferase involved in cell wall biosynthesis